MQHEHAGDEHAFLKLIAAAIQHESTTPTVNREEFNSTRTTKTMAIVGTAQSGPQ
jgi:hypothetical protein